MPAHGRRNLSIVLALPVGMAAGLGAVVFNRAIAVVQSWTGVHQGVRSGGLGWVSAASVVVGAAAAAILLVRTGSVPTERGMPLVLEAESADLDRLPERSAWWRSLASALAIGTGSSAGHEGPSVLLAAVLGERLGRRVSLDEEEARRLVAAAAAAGIAAALGLPLVAALFVIEVFLPRRGWRSLMAIAVGAASGWSVWAVVGTEPHLLAGSGHLEGVTATVGAVPVALVATVASVALTYGIIGADRLRARLPLGPVALMAVGGAVVGTLGLGLGAVVGDGQDAASSLLEGRSVAVLTLLLLGMGKVLATSSTLGSGMPGGAFTPAAVVGAASGALVAVAVGGGPPEVRSFALVGAAAAVAALSRAPLTAVALVLETTSSLVLVPATVLAVTVALVLAHLTGATRIYDAGATS